MIFVLSLALLIKASDVFVESAEKIGLALGVSPFIIGVTIIAFGTSLPELATSIASFESGASEIVLGNVVGSNITNILLIVGAVAVIGKGIDLDYDIMNIDIPLLLGSVVLFWFSLWDGQLAIVEVILLLFSLVVFLLYSIRKERSEKDSNNRFRILFLIKLIVAGVAIYFSAEYVIYGLKGIAQIAKVPEATISLGALALGTSLPELIVSLSAIKRNNHSIAVGNVVGSNIFNTYGVVGISSLFGNLVVPPNIMNFSIPFMAGVTLIFTAMMFTKKVSLWEGILLLTIYVYYLFALVEDTPISI